MHVRRLHLSPPARTILAVLALFVGGVTVGATAPAILDQLELTAVRAQEDQSSSPVATSGDCTDGTPGAGAEAWVRSELFFGTAKPDGPAVTDQEWEGFLDREITPRFPDGLTVLDARGQYREADGTIVEERTKLLILLYPPETARDSSTKIEQIREAYEGQFRQESVLRADDGQPVCTSF